MTFIGIGVAVTVGTAKTELVAVGKTFTVSVELTVCPGSEYPQADSIPEQSKMENTTTCILLIISLFIVRQVDPTVHQLGTN